MKVQHIYDCKAGYSNWNLGCFDMEGNTGQETGVRNDGNGSLSPGTKKKRQCFADFMSFILFSSPPG